VSDHDGLLDGITVLDFTRVLAGPWATRMLADLGARVIKVERAGEGDDTRRGYFQLEEGRTDQSTYFTRVNAGKLSIAIELTQPAARPLVADLVRHADVVIENFVPGVVDKLGCDYATLSAIKPDLVYCSISGFGQTGPLRGWPAFAHIIDAVSGLMDLGRDPDPAPRVAYLQAADVLAGTHAFGAISAALFRRARTGRGAHLDVSMLEAVVAAEDLNYGAILNTGEPLRGARSGMIVHRIGDRSIVTQTVGSPQLWPRLLKLMDRPDLNEDPRFASPLLRRRNWLPLKQIIVEWLDRFPTAEAALAALNGARLPCAPVLTPEEVVAHPHLAARRFFPEISHPKRGRVRVTGMPFHVDGDPLAPAGPAPYRPGEHSRQVLSEILGYPDDRIRALHADGTGASP
jgi:crotonobetainyl-CoA:carnitine CoA-transferase CaiB-like acyl-CoA transferase